MKRTCRGAAVLGIGLLCGTPVAPAAEGPYRQLKEIPIGGEGGWDYLTVDAAARRLYVSHATKVVVVDLDKDAVVGEIAPAPGVHGIALAPELGRGFVSNGRESTVSIVDLQTLQIVGAVKTGANPDAILYDPARKEVYAFNHTGHSVTVFDAKTGELRATIPLPGVAEFAVLDSARGRVYVNVEDTSQIVAIDTATRSVAAAWPLAPCEEPTGLALDPGARRLFAACGNERLVMTDAVTGKVLASAPIGAGADGAAFDPGTGLAFASNGDGTLTVARPVGSDTLAVVQTLSTPKRSRTMTLDLTTHRLYVAAAEFGPPATGPDGKPQRPPIVPGSFKVVVYERTGPPGH
jgi:DNA-binding beta-propeller fold protein YncE